MPYFKVKEESGTKKLVDYSMPPVLDASEVGYDSGTVEAELDRINSNLNGKVAGRYISGSSTVTIAPQGIAELNIEAITGETISAGQYIEGLTVGVISGDARAYMSYSFVPENTIYVTNNYSQSATWTIVVRAIIYG